jgi:hypothetical protein
LIYFYLIDLIDLTDWACLTGAGGSRPAPPGMAAAESMPKALPLKRG